MSSHFHPAGVASMPKKSCGRKKGIQQGIPRGRFGETEVGSGQENENELEKSKFLCFRRSKFSSIGEKCFDIVFASCTKFHLISFTRSENGEYVPSSRKAQILHYVIFVSCLAICGVRIWATVRVFLFEELRLESFMCLSVAVIHTLGILLGLPVVLKPKETMDLLNSWPYASASLKKIDPSYRLHPLKNMSACLKVVTNFLVHQGIVLAVPFMSVFVDDLPVFLIPTVERLGLLPGGLLPKWAWQIMFAPLEWLLAEPFMLVSSFTDMCVFMGTGAIDVYLQRLRCIQVHCLEARQKLEHMYVQLELFNKVTQVWFRFAFPPWLLGFSTGVIVTAFVAIRYTNISLIFYVFFPYTGVSLMILIFWQCQDMLNVIRASEDVLGGLWRHDASYFRGMTRTERVGLMKRSKAMRPLRFILADSEFDLSLPVSTWDEIVNQTLFLLSLAI